MDASDVLAGKDRLIDRLRSKIDRQTREIARQHAQIGALKLDKARLRNDLRETRK